MPTTDLKQKIAEAKSVTLADLQGAHPPEPPRGGGGGDGGGGDRPGGPSAEERSLLRHEMEEADFFVLEHRRDLRYVIDSRAWLIWDGKMWVLEEAGPVLVFELAKKTAVTLTRRWLAAVKELGREMEGAADEIAKLTSTKESAAANAPRIAELTKAHDRCKSDIRMLNKRCDQIQTMRRLEHVIGLARSDERIRIDSHQLDADPNLLNCPNGILDLRTGALRAHDREAYCTRITGVPFIEDAQHEALDAVLRSSTGADADLQEYLRKVLGHSIIGSNRMEKFYLAIGPGGSGKGTLFEGIKSALGEYCLTAEFQSFVRTQGHRVRDDLMRLYNAHMVLASEIEKGERLAAGVVKQLTGNDTVAARHLFSRYVEFRPRLALWLQANDLPLVDDQDSGIWRRMVAIPFANALPEDQRDPDVKEAMLDPLKAGPAILAWLVSGARETIDAKRIAPPMAVRTCTQNYNDQMNPTKDFLESSLRFAEDARFHECFVSQKGLRKAYEDWYQEQGGNPRYILSPKALTERLKSLGRVNGRVRVIDGQRMKCWVGVTLAERSPTHSADSYIPSESTHIAIMAGLGLASGCTSSPQTPLICNLPTNSSEENAHSQDHAKRNPLETQDRIDTPEIPLARARAGAPTRAAGSSSDHSGETLQNRGDSGDEVNSPHPDPHPEQPGHSGPLPDLREGWDLDDLDDEAPF